MLSGGLCPIAPTCICTSSMASSSLDRWLSDSSSSQCTLCEGTAPVRAAAHPHPPASPPAPLLHPTCIPPASLLHPPCISLLHLPSASLLHPPCISLLQPSCIFPASSLYPSCIPPASLPTPLLHPSRTAPSLGAPPHRPRPDSRSQDPQHIGSPLPGVAGCDGTEPLPVNGPEAHGAERWGRAE